MPNLKFQLGLTLAAIGVLFLTNPPKEEYISWVRQNVAPAGGEAVLFSLIGSPIIGTVTERENFALFSVYKTQIDSTKTLQVLGIFDHFVPIPDKPRDWVPGTSKADSLHVIAAKEEGRWRPEDGYEWVVPLPNSGDFRVRWVPGRASTLYPHVIATNEEERWLPADGYVWVIDPPPLGDFRVRWSVGRHSTLHPHVIAANAEGRWLPENGYTWVANPQVDGDFRTQPFKAPVPSDNNNAVSKGSKDERECQTISSRPIQLLHGDTFVYEGHVVCKASACTPDQRIGAHWRCPENGTPIGPWEYTFSPTEGTKWRLLGHGSWQPVQPN